MIEEEEGDIQGFSDKTEGEILEERCGWDDIIKMNLQEISWEVVEWIHLAQDGELWRAVVYMVLHLRAS
jgi:hypothetical protein